MALLTQLHPGIHQDMFPVNAQQNTTNSDSNYILEHFQMYQIC